MTPEQRLAEAGVELPDPVKPVAAYVPAVRTGNLVFVSGQVPVRDGRITATGRVGAEVDLQTGVECARIAGLNCLAALKAEVGALSAVTRIVRLGVFVASAPGFHDQPRVANGASELMQQAFGDAGRHARAAVGVSELPLGVPVEVELVAEVG